MQTVAALLATPGAGSVTQKVYAALAPAVERLKDLEDDDRLLFRDALNRFVRIYSFLSQIVPFADTTLERDFLFGKAWRP